MTGYASSEVQPVLTSLVLVLLPPPPPPRLPHHQCLRQALQWAPWHGALHRRDRVCRRRVDWCRGQERARKEQRDRQRDPILYLQEREGKLCSLCSQAPDFQGYARLRKQDATPRARQAGAPQAPQSAGRGGQEKPRLAATATGRVPDVDEIRSHSRCGAGRADGEGFAN